MISNKSFELIKPYAEKVMSLQPYDYPCLVSVLRKLLFDTVHPLKGKGLYEYLKEYPELTYQEVESEIADLKNGAMILMDTGSDSECVNIMLNASIDIKRRQLSKLETNIEHNVRVLLNVYYERYAYLRGITNDTGMHLYPISVLNQSDHCLFHEAIGNPLLMELVIYTVTVHNLFVEYLHEKLEVINPYKEQNEEFLNMLIESNRLFSIPVEEDL